MTARPRPRAETVAAACPRYPLARSRPAADNGPHWERSFRAPVEEPARAEPPYPAAAFVNYAALHRRIEHPAARRWPGALPAFADLPAGLPHMPMSGSCVSGYLCAGLCASPLATVVNSVLRSLSRACQSNTSCVATTLAMRVSAPRLSVLCGTIYPDGTVVSSERHRWAWETR